MQMFLIFLLLPSVLGQSLTSSDIISICESPRIGSCEDCIAAHPECAWCDALNTENSRPRCRTYADHNATGTCPSLQFLVSDVVPTKNLNLTVASGPVGSDRENIIQLQPQEIRVKIRNGSRTKFNVTFRKVTDYPVDLYYLTDLSYSMRDDLATLKRLGQELATNVRQNVTEDIQMGFGTFVDKVLLPFASTVPDLLRNPCEQQEEGQNECAPPFDFRHQLQMTQNLERFRESVENTTISGNIDTPEGVFDALMQIAVCYNEIGWRNDSSHLVVITTDAPFHMALDGKLAAIFEANDMMCHLSEGANPYLPPEDVVYDRSKDLDYPSIGQLRAAFVESRIQPIFAVTEDVRPLYEELQSLIPSSSVDTLNSDSSNIISIIQSAYNQLRGRLDMRLNDHELPPEIDLKVRTLCPNATEWKDTLSCDQIQIGSMITYEFDISATGCRSTNPSLPLVLSSSSLREEVKIYFDFLCTCNCSANTIERSSECNGNGSFSCGACVCDPGFEGPQCQCQREDADESLLMRCFREGETGEACEGNGECICGECVCNDGFYGDFCECSMQGCARDNNGICGGEERGICRNCAGNNTCICQGDYYIDSFSETCSCSPSECKAEGSNETCSGNGRCDCNRCICDKPDQYSGTHCENCISPECHEQRPGCDQSNRFACALCVNELQQRRESEETQCNEECREVAHVIVPSIPDCQSCRATDSCSSVCDLINVNILPPQSCEPEPQQDNQCRLEYLVVWSQENDYLLLIKEFNQEEDCPQPVDPLVIVLPIVASIVVLGVIGLLIWKYWQTQRDRREWENFQKEQANQKWTPTENPIFEKPSARFENPLFLGN